MQENVIFKDIEEDVLIVVDNLVKKSGLKNIDPEGFSLLSYFLKYSVGSNLNELNMFSAEVPCVGIVGKSTHLLFTFPLGFIMNDIKKMKNGKE